MFLTRSEYDRNSHAYSPEGRLYQVEYAIEAIKLGATAMGVATSEGVLLEKIMEIDSHLGCAMSGLTADARILVEHARVESQNHRFTYDEPILVESVTQSICDRALQFGEDADEVVIYHAEPSGTYYRYDAKAIGAGSEGAQSELQNEYHSSMTLKEGEMLILRVLRHVMEETLDAKNVQLASVTHDHGFQVYSDEKMQEIVSNCK
ncbi:hypothetical protein MERGE_000550 [Pneumocystis wakefieldiae]|uniref:Proteasome alpha-type subunits domain-containing protein n=1 Tax=Pneumocystis wakefieldiae TaxID=38082 RepID=A0A899G0M6_9ASCO|nr:hypothetical protein MERGE_000550 [Pneumocystis wakefieldiae]